MRGAPAITVVAVLAALIGAPAAPGAAPGLADPGYGSGGRAMLSLGDALTPAALAIDAQGRAVVGGSVDLAGNGSSFVARFTPAGAPDAAFGSGGSVVSRLGGQDTVIPPGVTALATRPDGGVLAAGLATDATQFLQGLLPGGAPDPLFGAGGAYLTPQPIGAGPARVLPLAGGGAVLAGSVPAPLSSALLERFTATGAPDPALGGAGSVDLQLGVHEANVGASTVVLDAAMTASGDLLICGERSDSAGRPQGFVARVNPSGTLAAGFGRGGVAATGAMVPERVVVTAQGGAVLAGPVADAAGRPAIELLGFTPEGRIDPAFGAGGRVVSELEERPARRVRRAIAVHVPFLLQAPDSSLLVGSSAPRASLPFVVARFRAAGAIDCGYGAFGRSAVAAQQGLLAGALTSAGEVLLADRAGRHTVVLRRLAAGAGVPGAGPAVAGTAAPSVGRRGVRLSGVIDPRCSAARVRVAYRGAGQAWRFTPSRAADPRLGPQAVAVSVPGLARGRYEARLEVAGAAGRGAIVRFTVRR